MAVPAIRRWSSSPVTLTAKIYCVERLSTSLSTPSHRKESENKMDINLTGDDGLVINTGVKAGEPYLRYTLTEAINLRLRPSDDGYSRVRKYKERKNIKYIVYPLTDKTTEVYKDTIVFSLPLVLDIEDKEAEDIRLSIPSTNIASADFSNSYPCKRFYRWKRYKEKGKKFIKAFGIILGFILVITQIVVNIVTISSF